MQTSKLCVLIGDGSSEAMLLPLVQRVLDQYAELRFNAIFFQNIDRPSAGLLKRATSAIKRESPDLLLIHRDTEKEIRTIREQEISQELHTLNHPWVPLIPVRMSEAWLLVDEEAIRYAAGNPRGTADLRLPPLHKLETLPDPKEILCTALEVASEMTSANRKRRNFNPYKLRHYIANQINDLSTLRRLPSFSDFEKSLHLELKKMGWI